MHILQIIPWYPDEQNSHNPTAGTFFKEQFRYLFSKIDMTVVHMNYISIFNWKNNIDRLLKVEDVSEPGSQGKIYRINIPSIPKLHGMTNSIALFLLNKAIKKQKFDLVQAHVTFPSGYITYQFSQKNKIPYIITEHASYFDKFQNNKNFEVVRENALKYIFHQKQKFFLIQCMAI